MTILEMLKLAFRNIFLILIVTLGCTAVGGFVGDHLDKNNFQSSLFISIGIQDKFQNTNAYENLQAADQITESIQGWFKDPTFQNNVNSLSSLNFPIKAKKQEKNNLIVEFPSDHENNAMAFSKQIINELNNRINSYNNSSDLKINISNNYFQISEKKDQLPLYLILSTLLGIILGYAGAFAFELITNKLRSLNSFVESTGIKQPFTFANAKQIKTNYQFLAKHLTQKFGEQKVQIIDLTHKSKVGLEVISKQTNFSEIKSFDLPSDIEKINPNKPTIIIAELGFTTIPTLKSLGLLNFPELEGIVFDTV